MAADDFGDLADLSDGCACGLPADAPCHLDDSSGCCCTPERHVYGCHWLPSVMAERADSDGSTGPVGTSCPGMENIGMRVDS